MKKTLIFAAMAALALVGCSKTSSERVSSLENELSVVAVNSNVKGYSTGETFYDITYENLQAGTPTTARNMQISAYLYPQNGEQGNYFVNKTFAQSTDDTAIWWNVENGVHVPIYWPVGSTLDFLAFSLSNSDSKNVTVAWDKENAASKVVLGVPAENTQNDILFASVANQESKTSASAVPMQFKHSQAWLEFGLKTNIDDVVTLKRIELEEVYNAGDLTITNNRGNALAEWSFAGQPKNIVVDNNRTTPVAKLNKTDYQYLDMLIPEQKKTAFVLYYTLGNSQELSYRFETDKKTWLMGEKYVYNIIINTAEITVEPKVKSWGDTNILDAEI